MPWSLSDESYDFVKEWKSYAEETGRDLFFRFFCYYLAFNHLYDSDDLLFPDDVQWLRETEETIQDKQDKRRHLDELDKIISLLRHLLSGPTPRFSFSVGNEEWKVLNTVEWKNPNTGNWGPDRPPSLKRFCPFSRPPSTVWLSEQMIRKEDRFWRTILAMTKVYRVRCNLFHGDKHITDEKDIRLVSTSNVVLERFLRGCAAERLGYEKIINEQNHSSDNSASNGFDI